MIKNKLLSISLGKEESHNLSLLAIHIGNASFELPYLDDMALEKMFGEIIEVGIEVRKSNCQKVDICVNRLC